jgi:hypothetical protein
MDPGRDVDEGNNTTGSMQAKMGLWLLDIDGRDWDLDKLIRIFNPTDAISKIKIPSRPLEDILA